ncbi:MAG: hypothetical protein QG646_4604 [Euryarchaeota archaeon]|jgi:hypothetical protein|nr:hypothetical protein [Euryarchaeota archaeon]
MMKMKHIIALCLVLTLLLPSTAFAATSTATPKLTVKVVKNGGTTVTAYYTYSGPAERYHQWNFNNFFKCNCNHRTYTFAKHGTYKVSIDLYTKNGKKYTAYQKVTV